MQAEGSEYWTLVNTWRVLQSPEYTADLDDWRSEGRQMTFLHVYVREWSKAVLEQMKTDLSLLREAIRGPIYATSNNSDDKWMRFVKLFGFELLLDYDDGEDIPRKIFILRDNHGRFRSE